MGEIYTARTDEVIAKTERGSNQLVAAPLVLLIALAR